ncbi:hypothetical protein J437_LFUL007929, partial [Ladona fulva]
SQGVKLFAFHSKVNEELLGTQAGTVNVDIKKKTRLADGKDYWVYTNSDVKLKVGDKLHYWYWVQHDDLGHQRLENVWTITALVSRDNPNQPPITVAPPIIPPTTRAPAGGGGTEVQPQPSCPKSVTIVNGAPACKGKLIFEEQFKKFDLRRWQHEITLSGGKNWEFQLYDNNRTNSYVRNENLIIKPTLTADRLGNDYHLFAGELSLQSGEPGEKCTNDYYHGCYKRAFGASILNPVQSARIRTHNSFSFMYGKVEVKAKLPAGDWIHPAIWLAPRHNEYGSWPASGIIMLAEARGNGRLKAADGKQIGGNSQVDLGLTFAPFLIPSGRLSTTPPLAGRFRSQNANPDEGGYLDTFHKYQLEWTPEYMKFSVDDKEVGRVAPKVKSGGLWHFANFPERVPGVENPWRFGTKLAPFDQEPSYDFWSQKNNWYRSWRPTANNGEHAALQVDYIKVWSL